MTSWLMLHIKSTFFTSVGFGLRVNVLPLDMDKRRGKFMLLSTCFACQENQRGFIEICNFRLKKIMFKNLCSLLGQVSILKIAELML